MEWNGKHNRGLSQYGWTWVKLHVPRSRWNPVLTFSATDVDVQVRILPGDRKEQMASIENFSLKNEKRYGSTDFDVDLFFNNKKVATISDRHFGIPYEVKYESAADQLLVEMFLESPGAVKLACQIEESFRKRNNIVTDKPLPAKWNTPSLVYYLSQQGK